MNRFKPKYNIKKNDMVVVISGDLKPQKDDNGKIVYKPRKVLKVLPEDARIMVEGVIFITNHNKS